MALEAIFAEEETKADLRETIDEAYRSGDLKTNEDGQLLRTSQSRPRIRLSKSGLIHVIIIVVSGRQLEAVSRCLK